MDASLSHLYWIGGSPCAGKSAIADRLAAAHEMAVYRCDDAYFRHQEVITPEEQPVFSRLSRASCDELWMRPVRRQVDEEVALYREEFPLILADLGRLPVGRPAIVEGAALLPELLDGLGCERRRAIWMVPTEAFQREHYAGREWRHDVLGGCADKEQAWRNWMERDAGFAWYVARDASVRGFRLLTVDGERSVDEMVRSVEAWFGLSS